MPCGNVDPSMKSIYYGHDTRFFYYRVNNTQNISPKNQIRDNSIGFAMRAFRGPVSALTAAQLAFVANAANTNANTNGLYTNRTFFSTNSTSNSAPFTWQLDCIRGVLDDNTQYAATISSYNETYIQNWASKHKQLFEQQCTQLNIGLNRDPYVPYLANVYPGVLEGNYTPSLSGISQSAAKWILWYPVMACYARGTCAQLPAPAKVVVQ